MSIQSTLRAGEALRWRSAGKHQSLREHWNLYGVRLLTREAGDARIHIPLIALVAAIILDCSHKIEPLRIMLGGGASVNTATKTSEGRAQPCCVTLSGSSGLAYWNSLLRCRPYRWERRRSRLPRCRHHRLHREPGLLADCDMTERLLLRALEAYPHDRSHWPVHDSLGAEGCYLPPANRACHKWSFLIHGEAPRIVWARTRAPYLLTANTAAQKATCS